jgi:hypothetical protein
MLSETQIRRRNITTKVTLKYAIEVFIVKRSDSEKLEE